MSRDPLDRYYTLVHVADEVAAGRRPETDNNDSGAEGRKGGCDEVV